MYWTMAGPSVRRSPSSSTHLALGVDGKKVSAGFGLLRADVDLLELEGQAGLAKHNMRRQRTGSRREIEFHDEISWGNGALGPGTWICSFKDAIASVAWASCKQRKPVPQQTRSLWLATGS